ncbi:hypothetical protein [Serratia sp. SCBI]|uniref:hypothetical protein n=1 Tax=Serratia sp. SCBI TaxID=488142 RepID=UPI000900737B|nr:hypothetical protein [Serratia sp. SCBI]
MKRLDLVGKKYGELTVIGFSHSHTQPSGQKRAMWSVVCSCGVEKIVSTANLTAGTTISCGHIGEKRRIESRRMPDGEAAKNSLFISYRHGAKNRGIEFKIGKDQFYETAVGACTYCGSINPQTYNGKAKTGFKYCGIDRVDSSKGYEVGNIVTCCGICNMMKNNLALDVFLNHIKRISEYANAQRS